MLPPAVRLYITTWRKHFILEGKKRLFVSAFILFLQKIEVLLKVFLRHSVLVVNSGLEADQ